MKGKPFRSLLEQHYEFIRDERRKRTTWTEIAHLVSEREPAIVISDKGIIQWFKRRQRRKSLPLGFEDTMSESAKTIKPSIQNQERVSKLLNSSLSTSSQDSKWNLTNSNILTKKESHE